MLKRCTDIILSGVGLIIISPVLLFVGILIKLMDPGPVFYKQERIGKHKKPFHMVKFRTMVVNADKIGAHVTTGNDTRITPVGNILRRYKLDELPELWNVFIGDMSLVGPRPEVPRYVEQYPDRWDRIFEVRPGITDLATLQFRDEQSVLMDVANSEQVYLNVVLPIKIRLSLWYTEHQSFSLDVRILLDTVLAITVGRFRKLNFGPDWSVIARERIHRFDKQNIE